jgi:hypothetical protein
MKRRVYPAILLLTVLACAAVPASAQQIWMAAVSPYTQAAPKWRQWHASIDYMDLFRPDAPWQTVAGRTSVFKIGTAYALSGNEDQLRTIFGDLERRGIALGLESGLLPKDGPCGKRDEAHIAPDLLEKMLARLKTLGAHVKYVAIDEAVTYGYKPKPDGSCSEPASEIAKQIAPNISLVKRYFPNAQIGDIEVVNLSQDLTNQVKLFPALFAAATGSPLAFMHTDVNWSDAALRNLAALAQDMKAKGIPFGVIYTAAPDVDSDVAWTANVRRHIAEVETEFSIRPDAAVFQTWVKYPSHLLPESQDGTLTNLMLGYLRDRPSIKIARSGQTVSGILSDSAGRPIPNATVTISAEDVRGVFELQSKQITGTVPQNARSAVIGVRIDTEGVCACAGDVDAKLGTVEYREGIGRSQVIALPGESGDMREFHASKGNPQAVNSRAFLVTPGVQFSLTIPASVTAQSEGAGYVAVIFLGADGKGVLRQMWRFKPNQLPIGEAKTDSAGRFSAIVPPAISKLDPKLSAHFEGDSQRRSAVSMFN